MISRALFLLLAVGMLPGCATQKMSGDQLARVAKDWSLSIRASQIIPVYPLTEDLQPRDVFLVQNPVEEQVKVYLAKGFLPLENLGTCNQPLRVSCRNVSSSIGHRLSRLGLRDRGAREVCGSNFNIYHARRPRRVGRQDN